MTIQTTKATEPEQYTNPVTETVGNAEITVTKKTTPIDHALTPIRELGLFFIEAAVNVLFFKLGVAWLHQMHLEMLNSSVMLLAIDSTGMIGRLIRPLIGSEGKDIFSLIVSIFYISLGLSKENTKSE